jgi:hypothetical protein
MRTLEEGIERRMIAAAVPVPDDQRTLPDGIEDVTRDISKVQISSFSLVYKEQMAVEWNAVPQGQLQNITQLKDRSGKALQWKDYFTEIDLDDPFFRRLLVNVQANADFTNLPIHSVEVKLLYDGRPMPNLTEGEPEGETVLNHADDVGKFATFVEGDNWEYEYSYEINYRGAAQTYQSPPLKTNEGNLTIGVDDVGILAVDVTAGDLNWNDVSRALVTFRYEDPGHVELIEDQFELTAESPTHEIQHIIFEPMRKNYTYRVKYFLKNGKEVGGKVDVEGRADRLFINDMFVGQKVIGVRGVGDFATRIQTIFLDLEYLDRENEYRQTKSQALNRDVPFFDWSFPILSDAGVVSYKGTVSYTDGTSEPIPSRVAATDTIIVPDAVVDFLEVMVVPDLIDWGTVRLARVSLAYTDPPNNVAERKDFIFSAANRATQTWKVAVKDLQKMTYSHSAVFFMADGTQRSQGPTETAELTLILDPLQ